jgi:hypothetical protein
MSFKAVLGNTEFELVVFGVTLAVETSEILDFFNDFFKKWDKEESTVPVTDTSTDTPCPKAERLVSTASVTPKTTNSNSVLPNTALNDIQQHVNSANSGDVDIRNLSITLIRTVVWRSSNRIAIILYQG